QLRLRSDAVGGLRLLCGRGSGGSGNDDVPARPDQVGVSEPLTVGLYEVGGGLDDLGVAVTVTEVRLGEVIEGVAPLDGHLLVLRRGVVGRQLPGLRKLKHPPALDRKSVV